MCPLLQRRTNDLIDIFYIVTTNDTHNAVKYKFASDSIDLEADRQPCFYTQISVMYIS